MEVTVRVHIENLDELVAAILGHNVAVRQLAEAVAGAKVGQLYEVGPATVEAQEEATPQRIAEEIQAQSPVAAVQTTPSTHEKNASKVELRTLLAELTQAGKGDQVQDLIKQFGAKRFSEIPEEKYADLWAAAEALK